MTDVKHEKWWGDVELPIGRGARWVIGPRHFSAQRRRREWLLAKKTDGDSLLDVAHKEINIPVEVLEEEDARIASLADDKVKRALNTPEVMRFAFDESPPILNLQPALADRPVVSYLSVPFMVLPGQAVRFFLTTPLWCQFQVRTATTKHRDATLLSEIAITRPSDTWAGDTTLTGLFSTIAGTLAYASSTVARMHLEDVLRLPQRAITEVLVKNISKESVRLERLQLPTENLSLFVDDDNIFWTSRYSLRFAGALSGPTVKIYDKNERKSSDHKGVLLQKIAPPRREVSGVQSLLKLLSILD